MKEDDGVSKASLKQMHDRGNDFYRRGDYEKAIQCYIEVLEADAEMTETHFNLALAYTRSKQYDMGLEEIEKCTELLSKKGKAKSLGECYFTKGLILEYKMMFAKAVKSHLKAAEVEGDVDKRKKYAYQAGISFTKMGDVDEALKYLGENGNYLGDKYALRLLGSAYEGRDEFENALRHYRLSQEIEEKEWVGEKIKKLEEKL